MPFVILITGLSPSAHFAPGLRKGQAPGIKDEEWHVKVAAGKCTNCSMSVNVNVDRSQLVCQRQSRRTRAADSWHACAMLYVWHECGRNWLHTNTLQQLCFGAKVCGSIKSVGAYVYPVSAASSPCFLFSVVHLDGLLVRVPASHASQDNPALCQKHLAQMPEVMVITVMSFDVTELFRLLLMQDYAAAWKRWVYMYAQ